MSPTISAVFLCSGLLLLGFSVSWVIPAGALALAASYHLSPMAKEAKL